MTLERIYKQLNETIEEDNNINIIKYLKLREDLEQAIREETCYKTTPKTRINAIKRVASKDNCRPVLQGYGVYEDYKVVTDSYHMIAIHQEDMPLKLVTSDNEEAKRIGKENCIYGIYPNLKNVMNLNIATDENYETYEELNVDDVEVFYKLHKSEKEAVKRGYNIDGMYIDINFMKNAIDVIGKENTIYIPKDRGLKPVYFVNKDNEIALLLPIRMV